MSLQDLIPVVNKLQDIVTTTQLEDLDLPLLAVVGSQSCGKSSVLENIVGKDFLPRGTGIVTRRPLVLQLINISEDDALAQSPRSESSNFNDDSSSDEINLEDHLRRRAQMNGNGTTKVHSPAEWGEFLHIPNKRFYSFQDIRAEIENETHRIAGVNKGISRLPINLKIYSSRVLNLTLVDLPGLTKIPIGDQPTDIERQTRNLILEYISKPNCIILAVSPANVDLVNSESLKLARQVDPTGKRTVGVLTKLDLMDQGTNAMDILKGNVYPLKLGFIGIVNRSQQDISDNKSLDDSLFSEAQFFQNHPAYKSISNKCGTKYLAQTLNRILMNHIRDRLPDIKAKLNTLMGQAEQELASYGSIPSNLTDSKEARGGMVLTLMTKFANSFVHSVEGTSLGETSTKELCGGARIYYIYNEVYGAQLAAINPTHNLSIHDIRTAIRNSTGPRPALFVPELAFDLLVKPQIKLLEEPSKRCVELVYEELMKIVHNVCSINVGPELNRYPRLQSKLIEVVSDLLRERLGPTIKYVESLIEIHRAYINTNHPNFVGAAKAMSIVVEERHKQKENESRSKLRLASERILNKKYRDSIEEEDEDSDEKNPDEDINSVDDEIKPLKHKRSGSTRTYSVKAESTPNLAGSQHGHYQHDSYLNYFFGKDPIIHQQHLQTQAQLNPTPFKFPHQQDATLQFNSNFINNGIINASQPNLDHFKSMSLSDSQQDDSMSFESDETINELSEREQLECELIRRLIISYFSIVREMIQDQVPKSIMCLLVDYIKQHIQNRLVVKLYNESLFDELLQEDEGIQAERDKCLESLKTYREASRIISDVV
ncbi:Dynamin central region-domain-containing protein [Scheffersomyces xylosifermentans]|uniref:Dynamin central region-domain-containing protein n=1 Tax=Scheffersomyces xylosifermentans TaxID=1304137 RepID=UPI00315D40D2